MGTFAQKAAEKAPAKPAPHGRAHVAQVHEMSAINQLQRRIGNQALQRMLQAHASETKRNGGESERSHTPMRGGAPAQIQPRLTINTPGDVHEQEADRVAEQVMRMSAPQRSSASGYPKQVAPSSLAQVQTKSMQATGAGGAAAPPIVHDVLRSPGRPLDAATRAFMEPRFGQDFGHVRVHTDARAAESARAVDARAYTVGKNLVFGQGAFETESRQGRLLLAHELTHVVQQNGRTDFNTTANKAHHSVQRFSGYEHVALGDSAKGGPSRIVLACHDKDFPERKDSAKWPAKWKALLAGKSQDEIRAVTQGLTYGEVVALSGDFYESFGELNEAPLTEILELIPLIRSSTATTKQMDKATGGRYMDLLKTNVSHFSNVPVGERNIDVWRTMHIEAVQLASSAAADSMMINTAWATNAAADHFLTDAFAAGHLRQPRAELMKLSGTDQLISPALHNLDNRFGVIVTNKRGDKPWVAYGDDALLTKGEPVHHLKVKEAVELSKKDIQDALGKGKTYKAPSVFPAENLVPFPASSWKGWSEKDAKTELKDIAADEGPGYMQSLLQDDNRVLAWLKKTSSEALKRQSAQQKLRMVDALMSGMVTAEDRWGVRQICYSTTSTWEQQLIQVDYDLSPCFAPENRPQWVTVGTRGRTKNR